MVNKIVMETNIFIRFNLYYDDLVRDYSKLFDFLHVNQSSPEYFVIMGILNLFKMRLSYNREITGGYKIFRVKKIETKQGYIEVENEVLYVGKKLASTLSGASFLALFVCTSGNLFTELTGEYSSSENFLEAYVADTLGSMTVELAMDRIHDSLESDMTRNGFNISNRYSPGYCGWSLEDQKIIFSLLGKDQTNILLSDSSLMIPIKSVSGIIGIGGELIRKNYECDNCCFANCTYSAVTSAFLSTAM